jgi:hypothetical protein
MIEIGTHPQSVEYPTEVVEGRRFTSEPVAKCNVLVVHAAREDAGACLIANADEMLDGSGPVRLSNYVVNARPATEWKRHLLGDGSGEAEHRQCAGSVGRHGPSVDVNERQNGTVAT